MHATPATPPGGRAIVVLGMARTGSSAVTRLLNLLGVDLGGDERLIAPVEHINAKGFYEHRAIMLLNTELMERLGGSWEDPPSPPVGWEDDPALDDLRARAAELLAESFGGAALWGF